MATKTVAIKHTPLEEWLNGPRVELFYIDHDVLDEDDKPIYDEVPDEGGEDGATVRVKRIDSTVYYVPEKPNAGFALIYLKAIRTMGQEAAMGWLFELAIGEKAYDDLSNESDFELEDLVAMMLEVQRRVLGGLDPKK
jgi:hypothetical protein